MCALIAFMAACSRQSDNSSLSSNPIANSTAKDIHDVETNLGRGQGEELFKSHCITCHSLRYIQMQPAFPRKTWEKIVDKMVKNFGAPIPDSTTHSIVDYLVSVKGKQ